MTPSAHSVGIRFMSFFSGVGRGRRGVHILAFIQILA